MKIPKIINLQKEGQYCINCYSNAIRRVFDHEKTMYVCDHCSAVNPRSLVIDNQINWWIDDEGNYWHESIGVILMNKARQILCLKRQIYPFAYGLPAGHLDKRERPLDAVQREVLEEIGLSLDQLDFQLMATFDLAGDSCRRGSDHHKWHLFITHLNNENLAISLNDESENFEWMNDDQLLQRDDVTFPLKYILATFGNRLK